jgi:hypothetical protein
MGPVAARIYMKTGKTRKPTSGILNRGSSVTNPAFILESISILLDITEINLFFRRIKPAINGCIYCERTVHINSKGFWRWCITLETIRCLDFVHRPMFSQKHNVSETDKVSETLCVWENTERWTKSKNVILSRLYITLRPDVSPRGQKTNSDVAEFLQTSVVSTVVMCC